MTLWCRVLALLAIITFVVSNQSVDPNSGALDTSYDESLDFGLNHIITKRDAKDPEKKKKKNDTRRKGGVRKKRLEKKRRAKGKVPKRKERKNNKKKNNKKKFSKKERKSRKQRKKKQKKLSRHQVVAPIQAVGRRDHISLVEDGASTHEAISLFVARRNQNLVGKLMLWVHFLSSHNPVR